MTDYTRIDSEPDSARREELYDTAAPPRFVPSTEELRHWIHYGIGGCPCAICAAMRMRNDEDSK